MNRKLIFCLDEIEAKHDDMLILFGRLKHFLKGIKVDKSLPVLCVCV